MMIVGDTVKDFSCVEGEHYQKITKKMRPKVCFILVTNKLQTNTNITIMNPG